MAKFEALRWAEALIGAAGDAAEEAVAVLAAIAPPLEAASRNLHGQAAAARLDEALGRAFVGQGAGALCARRVAVLLARRGFLANVGAVAVAARELLAERSGILRASLESAVPLSSQERMNLEAAISHAMESRGVKVETIELEERVDPGLLGGIRLRIGWERIDGTLVRRLEALASATGAVKRGGDTW